MADKIPPHDLESERSVLGAMMLSKDAMALIAGMIHEPQFYRQAHGDIFSAILALYQKNEPVDLITVSNELKKQKKLDRIGGRSYLTEVLDSVPSAVNANHYADIIVEKFILRQLLDTGSHMIGKAFDPSNEAQDVLEFAQRRITEISREGVSDDFVPLKKVLNTVFDSIQNTYDRDDKILGTPSGYPDLDTMTSGFQAGDLIILAARPSCGKTALCLNFAQQTAIQHNQAVAIFSCEMPKEQLGMRLLSAESKLDSKRLRTANLQDYEYKDLNLAFGRLAEAPIFIDDTPSITPLQLRAKCRRLQAETDVKLIIIDYLQLMRSSKKRVESRFHEVSEIVRDIKAFAKEAKIAIIALSQLSRDVEKRQDKRPLLSDLRESGEIEQTADLVLFIHREEMETAQKDIVPIQLVIAKQRNGPTGIVNLIFKKDISKFIQAAPPQDVPQ